jgi:phosphohistidine phosphatase SixA
MVPGFPALYRAIGGALIIGIMLLPAYAAAGNSIVSVGSDSSASAPPADLIERLQMGGYVIYFRHAMTNHDEIDQDRNDLSSCKTQRNLSNAGREQARLIGEAFRTLEITVGKILSSPYCRAKDTAVIAFGNAEISNDLRFGMGTDTEDTETLKQALLNMLSIPPEAGQNTVLVSHTANLKEATGIWPRPEGAAYIFKPLDSGGFSYLGTIPPDGWISQ